MSSVFIGEIRTSTTRLPKSLRLRKSFTKVFDSKVVIVKLRSIVTLLFLFAAFALCHGNLPADRLAVLSKYGLPDDQFLKPADGYLIGSPDRTRCPRWVLEVLDGKHLAGKAVRGDESWRADLRVPSEFRTTLKDYEASGFDRGHLAASADHTSSEAAQSATFTLANTMPQTPELNRGEWKRLEDHLRRRASESGVVAYVVTAPIWRMKTDDLKTQWIFAKTIGRGVWVPTHCAKAVLWEVDGKVEAIECWCLPNDSDHPVDDFQRHRISADELESISGLDLFVGLPDRIENELEAVIP